MDEGSDGVRFNVLVAPRASKTTVVGVHDGALKIRLAAPPVDGEANKELISFLAKKLEVGKSSLRILSGERSKRKRVCVNGCSAADVQKTLSPSFGW